MRVGQRFIAKDDVPDMIEPAVEFFKGHVYSIAQASETFVILENEYHDRSSFSLDPKNTANNYFWRWFRREFVFERFLRQLKFANLSTLAIAALLLTMIALGTDMLEKRVGLFVFLVIVWLCIWLWPVYDSIWKRKGR